MNDLVGYLKNLVSEKKYVDVGIGMQEALGVSRTKLNGALAILAEQGYLRYYVRVPRAQNESNLRTTLKVLTMPGTTFQDVYKNLDSITSAEADLWRTINGYAKDTANDIRKAANDWLVNLFGSVEEAEQYKDRIEVEHSVTFSDVPIADAQNNFTLRVNHTLKVRLKAPQDEVDLRDQYADEAFGKPYSELTETSQRIINKSIRAHLDGA
jgi:hypothetical protein